MSDYVKIASEELKQLILSSLGRLVGAEKIPAEPLPPFRIEVPADKSHGDFAVNVAMVSAKALKMPPRKIAELVCQELDLEGSYFDKVEIAGPGFINFFLNQKWFSSVVDNVITEKDKFGRTNLGSGKRVLVEFVSANPTGPMHIGNARGGAIGDCLASVLDWAGYDVQREFYINDAGNQVEKFGNSLELRYLQLFAPDRQDILKSFAEKTSTIEDFCQCIYNDDTNFPMPEDVYKGVDIIIHAKNFADIHGDKFVTMDEQARKDALVEYALPLNIQGLERDLKKYRITYDNWFRESTLHNDGSVAQVIKKLKDLGYTYEQDGATWFKASKFGAEKDFVIVRANGIPTYVVPDIAYHYNKLVTRGFDKAIDVLGADHHGYVPRLKAALKALGVDTNKLDAVIMQMVRLVRNGETVKLSKRSGKAITLVTLLEDIPIDSARFFFNLREANSHFEFDLDLAIEQTSQNPVFYVQYAHARICSIINNIGNVDISNANLDLLTQPQERELIRYISSFPNEIDMSAIHYDPARITKYTIDLATKFHKFYDACSVKNAETQELMVARLVLCKAVNQVIENALGMLKVTCPDKM
ncbi:MAG: arginine--tRNA ligase [Ruminococcus sp.]|nr:arginine--tRNA ligase [Ruminococcus sp.]